MVNYHSLGVDMKNESVSRVKRTALQLIVGGALTAVIQAVANLKPGFSLAVMGVWTVVVSYAQNALEDSGTISNRK